MKKLLLILLCLPFIGFGQMATCDHTFNMQNLNWYGWYGASVDVTVNGVTVVAGATLDSSASFAVETFSASSGDTIDLANWVSGPYYCSYCNGEVYWNIKDGAGTTIASGFYGESGASTAYCTLPNLGCTDPLALNYDPTAINDDASCDYVCSGGIGANSESFETFTTTSYQGPWAEWTYDTATSTFPPIPPATVGAGTGLTGGWIRDGFGTPSSGTGPLNGATSADGNYYLYCETSGLFGITPPPIANLHSSCVDLSNFYNPYFVFSYNMFGATMGTLNVDISTDNTTTWTNLWTLSGDQGQAWLEDTVSLSAYSGQIVQLRMNYTSGTSFTGDCAIDYLRFNGDTFAGNCDIIFNTPVYQSNTSNTACDGFIIVSATSSAVPITYNWSNGVSGPNNINLCTGVYTITAVDGNGCYITDNFSIGQIIYGCMNPLVSNYNPSANIDDGSCCTLGCTDPSAGNYNPLATCDDSSCVAVLNGCTDSNASNYDTLANIDDGSCYYCDVSISTTAFQDPTPGYCNGLIISSATSSYSSVTYSWNTGSTTNVITSLCAGIYDLTAIDSLGCSATATYYLGTLIYGCTDSTATNYDPLATVDDGSCTYLICNEDAPTGLFASNIIHNRATINWDNMNSPVCSVDQYRIRYRETGTSSWSTKTMSGPVGSCNFASQKTDKLILNLTANTNYEYQMKAWYCGGGASSWSGIETFTTLDNCPNVGNLAVYGATPTKATFTWDASNGVYSFVRLKARIDSISNPTGADFFQIGGAGVSYGTNTKNKNGLIPGETYRGQARTYCDPNGGGWKSLSWTPLVYWTQPTLRIEGGEAIANLAIYPNPSKDVFNISFTSERVQDLKVRVLNVVGEEIVKEELQQYIGEYTKQINLDNYSKGVYFLEIETNDGIINKKLILQ